MNLFEKEGLGSITKQIRHDSRSVKNRLQSIIYDSQWIKQVQESYDRPLIPNERCGLWYVEPSLILETSYFKSTDGHTGQWSFSTRRLNLHLLPPLIANEGLIVVDSTRRGKLMPDALSKTIPIWCGTLNYIMFGSDHETNWVFLPLQIISKSEASSIIELIPSFAKNLIDLGITSREKLLELTKGKYLRPLWVYPGMTLPFTKPEYEEFYPLICCVASMRADDGAKKLSGFTYVQGAADDHELWAKNLNPTLFWENLDCINDIELSDQRLLEIVDGLQTSKDDGSSSIEGIVQLTKKLYVGKITDNLSLKETSKFDVVVILSDKDTFREQDEKKIHRQYKIPSNKKGSNMLRSHLNEIDQLVSQHWNDEKITFLILCETGTDLSIGVALLILALKYDVEWEESTSTLITKNVMKRHLAKILEYKKVNPSRSTLQSINNYLM